MSKQSTTTSSSFHYRNRVNYIIIAILYCWLLWVSKVGGKIQKGVFLIMRLVVLIFLPKRYLKKFYRNYLNGYKAISPGYWNLEYGHHIRIAKNLVYDTCFGYVAFPITVVSGIVCALIGWNNIFLWMDGMGIFIIAFLIMCVMYIAVVRLTTAFSDPHVYLSYFKTFDNLGNEWLKKWKTYTILLLVGAILSAVMSFKFYLLTIDISKNIHGPFN